MFWPVQGILNDEVCFEKLTWARNNPTALVFKFLFMKFTWVKGQKENETTDTQSRKWIGSFPTF